MDPILKTSTEADSFAEYRAIRAGEKVPATPAAPAAKQPQEEKSSEQTPAPPSAAASESAVPSEGQETPQEKAKRDRSAEGRAAELSAQGRYDEALRILQEKDKKRDSELADLRKRLENPAPQPAAQPQPKAVEQPKPVDTDPKPKLANFVSKPGVSYEEAQEQYSDAILDWRDRQRQAEQRNTEQQREEQSHVETARSKITEARTKHADFDQVATGVGIGYDPPTMLLFLREFPDSTDVLYYLGQHPEEQPAIVAAQGMAKLALLADIRLKATVSPVTPKPAVSSAPPPPRALGGPGIPEPKDTSKALSFAEHKRLRSQRSG